MEKVRKREVYILSNKQGYIICIDHIMAMNSHKNYIRIHTIHGVYYQRATFKEALKYFDIYQEFVMPTYGTLININYIVRINWQESMIYLSTGNQYFITRKYRRKIYSFCQQYINQKTYEDKC